MTFADIRRGSISDSANLEYSGGTSRLARVDYCPVCRSVTQFSPYFPSIIRGGSRSANRPWIALGEMRMSAMERLRRAEAALRERASDPWRRALERDLPANITSISTAALLDLLDVPATTGNARRLAQTMRSLGFIPLKSRRLMPGGFRDTTIRGWARPVRESQR